MEEILHNWIPNVAVRLDVLWLSVKETLVMVGWAGGISFLCGIFLGVALTVTRPGNICQNPGIYQITDKIVNLIRSIPFIVLLACLVPLTRLIMGTSIGVRGAIVPLVFGCVPFFSRQIEAALSEIDGGLIEAAKSMGLSSMEIIIRVYLRESIAGIARGTTITLISLVGLTAMAGAIGAGGLGNFAIMYGHQRNMPDVTYTTVVLLVIMVTIIQVIGNAVAKKYEH